MDEARQDSKIMAGIKMQKSKAKKTKKQKASGEKGIIIVSGKNRKGQPGSTRMLKTPTAASQAESLTEKEKEYQVAEAAHCATVKRKALALNLKFCQCACQEVQPPRRPRAS